MGGLISAGYARQPAVAPTPLWGESDPGLIIRLVFTLADRVQAALVIELAGRRVWRQTGGTATSPAMAGRLQAGTIHFITSWLKLQLD